METLLTPVIAVGGIATGIGAIWTARTARRQAKVTERSIAEQTERARLEPRRDVWNAWRDITGCETRFVASFLTHVEEIAELGGDYVHPRHTI